MKNNNAIDILQTDLLTLFSRIYNPALRSEAISHTLQTATLSALIAMHRDCDPELSYAAALLHDTGKFLENSGSALHASKSAGFARRWIEEHGLFSREETEIICDAILHHSDKNRKEDSEYAEVLKDADCTARALVQKAVPENIFRRTRTQRVLDELRIMLPVQKNGNEY